MVKTLAVLLTSLAMAVPVWATPSCETLRANWRTHYFDAFGIKWGAKDTLDCPGGESKAAEAFYHLHASKLPADAPKFYQTAANLIRETYYDPDCTTHGAYASRALGRITLCRPFFEYGDAEYNSNAIVHEARHLSKADPGHVTCDQGPYMGQKQRCDQRFYIDGSGGAFSQDVFYWAWVRNAIHHELSDWLIQSYINNRVPDRFNEITPEEVSRWRRE